MATNSLNDRSSPLDEHITRMIDSTIQLSIDIDNLMFALKVSSESDEMDRHVFHTRRAVRAVLSAHENAILDGVDGLIKKIIKLNELSEDEKAILINGNPHIIHYLISPSEFLKNIVFLNKNI